MHARLACLAALTLLCLAPAVTAGNSWLVSVDLGSSEADGNSWLVVEHDEDDGHTWLVSATACAEGACAGTGGSKDDGSSWHVHAG